MARLLFWILLVGLAYAVARALLRSGADPSRAPDRASEAMVGCAACGLNLPQSEALQRDGRWYCSREHLERGGG